MPLPTTVFDFPVSEKLSQEDPWDQLEPAPQQRAEQPDRDLRQSLLGKGLSSQGPCSSGRVELPETGGASGDGRGLQGWAGPLGTG